MSIAEEGCSLSVLWLNVSLPATLHEYSYIVLRNCMKSNQVTRPNHLMPLLLDSEHVTDGKSWIGHITAHILATVASGSPVPKQPHHNTAAWRIYKSTKLSATLNALALFRIDRACGVFRKSSTSKGRHRCRGRFLLTFFGS